MSNLAVSTLSYALSGLGVEQSVVANNVANNNTPNFTATDVNFEQSLANALNSSQPSATAAVTLSPSTNPPGINGNNVSLSSELVKMEQASLGYQSDVNLIEDQFKLLSGSMGGQF